MDHNISFCKCDNCTFLRENGRRKQEHDKETCSCSDCERYRKQNPTAARAKAAADENERKHLNHPFYKRVENVVNEVAREQIIKGSEKYSEPFNPQSWTGAQLVKHGLQEARDLQVYLVGLLDHIERMDNHFKEKCEQYEELNRRMSIVDAQLVSAKEELEQHKEALLKVSFSFVKELGEKDKEIKKLREENERLEVKNITVFPQFTINSTPQGSIKEYVSKALDEAFEQIGKNIDESV